MAHQRGPIVRSDRVGRTGHRWDAPSKKQTGRGGWILCLMPRNSRCVRMLRAKAGRRALARDWLIGERGTVRKQALPKKTRVRRFPKKTEASARAMEGREERTLRPATEPRLAS